MYLLFVIDENQVDHLLVGTVNFQDNVNRTVHVQHGPSTTTSYPVLAPEAKPVAAALKHSGLADAVRTSSSEEIHSSSTHQLHHNSAGLPTSVLGDSHQRPKSMSSIYSHSMSAVGLPNPVLHAPSIAPPTGLPTSKDEENSGTHSMQSLTTQIRQMKNQMIQYASLLDNPEWKQQQPDRGKAVSQFCHRLHVKHLDSLAHAWLRLQHSLQYRCLLSSCN